jgi:hypothetical protein
MSSAHEPRCQPPEPRVKVLYGGRVDLAETVTLAHEVAGTCDQGNGVKTAACDRQPLEHRKRAALLRHYDLQVPCTKLNGCCAVEAGHLYCSFPIL